MGVYVSVCVCMCGNHGVSSVFLNSAESSLGPSALGDGTSSEGIVY